MTIHGTWKYGIWSKYIIRVSDTSQYFETAGENIQIEQGNVSNGNV